MNFLSELRRRNVIRVGLLYLFGGWLVLQAADVMVGVLGIPEWTLRFIVLLLALGLPFVLFFSWAYEITPEGIKREAEVDRTNGAAKRTGRKLDIAVIVVVLAGIGVAVSERYFPESSESRPDSPSAGLEGDRAASRSVPGGSMTGAGTSVENKTIAVLPFDNMSSDPEQEFFSDGITEEILNVLVRGSDFPVVSRTSSFSLKGSNLDARAIAEQLDARYLVEGSVRKAGNQLRITAQLIDASTDLHLWSDTYDRELVDVFVMQEEIAASIAAALHEQLGGGNTGPPIDIEPSTANLEAYQLFLRGRYLVQRLESDEGFALLQQAVELDPEFADAWANLALAAAYKSTGRGVNYAEWAEKARTAAQRGLALDPDQPVARTVLARLETNEFNWEEAIQRYESVLESHPRHAPALHDLGELYTTLGFFDTAIDYLKRAERADPAGAFHLAWLRHLAVHTGDKAMELEYLQKTRAADFMFWKFFAYDYERSRGNWIEAERIMTEAVDGFLSNADSTPQFVSLLIAAQQDPSLASEAIDAIVETKEQVPIFQAQDILTEFGSFAAPDVVGRAYELSAHYFEQLLERGQNGRFLFSLAWLWQPLSRQSINHPSIQEFFFRTGVVDFWNEHGWPEQCEPITEDRFRCR